MLILKQDQLDEAVVLLKKGQILVFPTETSYGLGCDAANQKAVNKIFQIKERPTGKPLLVVVSNVDMAKKYLAWNSFLDKIAIKYWPGAVTVVADYIGNILKEGLGKIPKEYLLADGVVSTQGALAVRVTAHTVAKFLAEQLGRPIVATSANIAEDGDLYEPEKIIKIFSKKDIAPDAILDYGVLPKVKPTTIVSVLQGEVKILRLGEIAVEI